MSFTGRMTAADSKTAPRLQGASGFEVLCGLQRNLGLGSPAPPEAKVQHTGKLCEGVLTKESCPCTLAVTQEVLKSDGQWLILLHKEASGLESSFYSSNGCFPRLVKYTV